MACKSLNGLDVDETWRTVGSLHRVGGEPLVQTVPSGCHHCLDPACLAGCPVDAYEKDPVTGIVAHLDDQCIGCRYCTLTCPYEVPRYNPSRGIVRKCDMCAGRLADGEAPACAQACPNGAIGITLVDRAAVRAATATGSLVPGAPLSSTTAPTTAYRTSRPAVAGAVPADAHALAPAHNHPPLVAMLVLTQVAVGTFAAQLASPGRAASAVGLLAGLAGVAASVLHLGRPLLAWRSVMGVRHSWLSREAVAFAAFLALAALAVVRPGVVTSAAATFAGAVGLWCSAMIYGVTGRVLWRPRATLARFALTAATLGPVCVLLTGPASSTPLALVAAAAGGAWAAWDGSHAVRRAGELGRTARLLRGPLALPAQFRVLLGVLGVLFALFHAMAPAPGLPVLALAAFGVAAAAERTLFFTAVTNPRMPGTFG